MKLYETIVFNQIKSSSRVIDLGCGDGQLLDALIQKNSALHMVLSKILSQF